MRMNRSGRTRVIVGGVATVLAVALAGCTADATGGEATPVAQDTASASAAPSPSATLSEPAAPEYSPDEQAAIDEAKAAVERFYEVTDALYADPESVEADALDSVAIDPVKTDELGIVGYYINEGQHVSGRTGVEFANVKSVSTKSNPDKFVYPEVYFDVCTDVSNSEVIDASGDVVDTSDASDRQSAVVGAYQEPGEGWFVHHQEYTGEGGACKR